jgi:hypothetical protein
MLFVYNTSRATAFESSAFYGPGIGPIFAQEFKCNGGESHLKDCEFVPNVECTHDRDISIFCTGEFIMIYMYMVKMKYLTKYYSQNKFVSI